MTRAGDVTQAGDVTRAGDEARPIGVRLVAAQGIVLAAFALTSIATALAVAPRVFLDHLEQAGHSADDPTVMHANEAFLAAGLTSLAVGLGIAAVVAVVVSSLAVRRITTSLRAVSDAAERVADGEFGVVVATRPAAREIDSLAHSFTRMSERLADSEATRTRMIGDLAHEIRTPLASVRVLVEGLEDGVIPATPATFATLREQTERLERLTADLREVSAAAEGRLDLHPVPTSAASLVARAVRAAAETCGRAGVRLTAADSGDVDVLADPGRALQVLDNLLANAVRHATGTVDVSLAVFPTTATISVTDDGDGIAPDHLTHVFDRFYRTDTARDRDHGGSGIGLTVSRSIAVAHGGTLTAHSAGMGHGATFTLTLPRA